MTTLFLIIAGLVIAGLLALYIWDVRQNRARERLVAGMLETEEEEVSLWRDAADLLQLAAIQQLLSNSRLTRRLDYLLKLAAAPVSLLGSIMLLVVATVIVAAIAYLIAKAWWASVAALLLTPLLLYGVLDFMAKRRVARHDAQLPGMVSQMITSLRSGGTPMQAMQAVSQNAPSPVRESMANLLHDIQVGRSGSQAWRDWGHFWNTRSSNMLALAIRLKWDTGGQMVNILEHVLTTMEFHRRMELRVQTITAQARLGAYFLSGLPFLLGAIMYSVRPEPIDAMIADPIGIKMIWAGIGLLIVGFFWMRRLARLAN
ncbi:MAG: type II secretion system F family protein [Methylophilaceae bacterium]|jgi:tight adherence protein B|nr:type II secretion system F family protein [Methylophilaceae bacterium]